MANVAAAIAFTLTLYLCSAPTAVISELGACTFCTPAESRGIVWSSLWGIVTALFLAPFAFVIMLPISIVMVPLARFVLERVKRRRLIILIGGGVGGLLGWPAILFLYGSRAAASAPKVVDLLKMMPTFMVPATMAGAAYSFVLTARMTGVCDSNVGEGLPQGGSS